MKHVFLLLTFVLVLSLIAVSQVPNKISYQGLLTTSSGMPVQDGSYNLTFNIFDVSVGGSTLWTEIQTGVSVQRGIFNVLLGSVTTFGISFNQTLFVEVTATSGPGIPSPLTFSPRSELTSSPYSFSVVGTQCEATGLYSSAGGRNNRARGFYSFVSGGGGATAADSNSAIGEWAMVGGGYRNKAGAVAVVGGGYQNNSNGTWASICGGFTNAAEGNSSAIGGGDFNNVLGGWGTVSGGAGNDATKNYSTVGGGGFNKSTGYFSTIGGGGNNGARGEFSVVSGGGGGSIADSNSAIGDYSTVSGGKRNKAATNYTVIGGGSENIASGLVATVGGGYLNSSSGNYATVGGGYYNATSGERAVVGGGSFNGARGSYSVVSGGGGGLLADSNSAIGDYASVPGGRVNKAAGAYSFAAGRRAKALHDGSFVWGDATDADFSTTASNQFIIRASGGVGIGTTPTTNFDINGMARIRNLPVNTGTTVVTDGGGNLFRSASSRRYKDNIRPLSINIEDVMKLQPVRFQYKETHVEDIGLIAEDVDEVLKDLVIYDSEEKPEAVKYDRIAVYLISIVKEQQKAIEELNVRNEKLETRQVELEVLVKSLAEENQPEADEPLAQKSTENKSLGDLRTANDE